MCSRSRSRALIGPEEPPEPITVRAEAAPGARRADDRGNFREAAHLHRLEEKLLKKSYYIKNRQIVYNFTSKDEKRNIAKRVNILPDFLFFMVIEMFQEKLFVRNKTFPVVSLWYVRCESDGIICIRYYVG